MSRALIIAVVVCAEVQFSRSRIDSEKACSAIDDADENWLFT